MNSITIGQYIKGNSWLHKLDPRMKIFLTIFYMVALFIIPNTLNGFYILLGLVGAYLIIYLTTRLPFRLMLKGLKPLLFLMSFTFLLQLIYNQDGTLLYQFDFKFGLFPLLTIILLITICIFTTKYMRFKSLYILFIIVLCFLIQWTKPFELMNFSNFLDKYNFGSYSLKIYDSGILKGSFVFVRIILLISITSLLTFTTMSTDINNGLYSLMSPLKVIKVPVGRISMMLSLTLRFIPTLLNETKKIMNAQASRGVDFYEASFKQKINQIIALLIPMFVISFKKAADLADAMEARGYIIDAKRSRYDVLKLHLRDYLSLVISLIVMAGVIVGRIML